MYCFERKIPGILIRERTNPEKSLLAFLGLFQSPQLTLESSLSSKKNVFVIDYFDSTNRLQDYASYHLARKWFPPEENVSFCDEGMSICLNFLVIYPKRSLKTTLRTRFDEEEEVQNE